MNNKDKHGALDPQTNYPQFRNMLSKTVTFLDYVKLDKTEVNKLSI